MEAPIPVIIKEEPIFEEVSIKEEYETAEDDAVEKVTKVETEDEPEFVPMGIKLEPNLHEEMDINLEENYQDQSAATGITGPFHHDAPTPHFNYSIFASGNRGIEAGSQSACSTEEGVHPMPEFKFLPVRTFAGQSTQTEEVAGAAGPAAVDPNYSCTYCPASFGCESLLSKHLRQPYENLAKAAGDTLEKFNHGGEIADPLMHIRTQLRINLLDRNKPASVLPGQKPRLVACKIHQCEECGATFPHDSNLRRHRLTHTGEKPWACDKCPARFNQKGNLQTHQIEPVDVGANLLLASTSRSPLKSLGTKKRSRKRAKRTPKKNRNKKRRNEGREYVNCSGKAVEGAKIGPLCKNGCPYKCNKISPGEMVKIFQGFWDLGSFDTQNAYIFGCIEVVPVQRRRAKEGNIVKPYKDHTFTYTVKLTRGTQRVCKASFLSMHGLHKHRGRVDNVCKQIKSNIRTPPTDKRGKHDKRPNRASTAAIDGAKQHINSIPRYQSHYSRAQNPDKTYFACDLNITKLYSLYLNYAKEQGLEKIVSADKYRRIFCEDFNIGFKLPASDTCKTCDSLRIKIDYGTEDEKKRATVDKEVHLRFAGVLKIKLQEMTEVAKNDGDTVVLTVDLQQALINPKLTVGPAFYSRKVMGYNVGIYNCGKTEGTMMLWDESIAARGSNEIASTILKYLKVNNIKAKKLIVFSDDCGGQDKNWNVMALWSYLIHVGMFEEIEHYFLIPGHSYLPSDRDFGKIEKFQKSQPNIYSPAHWRQVFENCGRKKFSVIQMSTDDFLNFCILKDGLIHMKKQTCINGEEVKFAEAICYRFQADDPWTMRLKHRMNEDFKEYCLRKQGNTSTMDLPKCYDGPRKIARKKVEDVIKLLDYIPPMHHGFYKALLTDNSVTCSDIDIL